LKPNKIAFLINPSSGTSASRKQASELISFLNEHPEYELYESKSAEEMAETTKHLATKNYQAVVGCGGDGTLNLVSKHLIGSDTALGMIGLGSGNGFARHQQIPLIWNKAIKILNNPKVRTVDTGLVNGIHFLNIAGIGFAAKISHAFKGQTKRGLSGYARTVFKNLKMEPFAAQISNESGNWQGEAWMVDFCNGSQWGNNFRIEPGARDDDGAFSAVIFKKINPLQIPALGFRFAANTVPQSPDVYTFAGSEFEMKFNGNLPLHVDGEPIAIVTDNVQVKVLPNNLKIWTPS
jgi:diacylglycerol kinase (ATP)